MPTITSNNIADYTLSFADIPFVADEGPVIRMDFKHLAMEESSILPPKKHQPKDTLYDELNRMIPFQYLQDFAPLEDYPGRTLDGIARRYPGSTFPDATVRIGDWYYPNGASRWSVFRGLATSTQVKQMLLAAQEGTSIQAGGSAGPSWVAKNFKMQCVPVGPPGNVEDYVLESFMYMLPPRPLGEDTIASPYGARDGLYLVTLVDERYYWQYSGTTIQPRYNSTWAGFLDQLSASLGIVLEYSTVPAVYSQPETDSQWWTNYENAATLLDAVAYNLGCVFIRNLDGSCELQNVTQAQTTVLVNRARLTGAGSVDNPQLGNAARVAGGNLFNSSLNYPVGNLRAAKNAVIPADVQVSFPKYVTGDDPVPHFLNPRSAPPQRPSSWFEDSYGDVYTVTVPIASGGPIVSGLVGTVGVSYAIHNTAKALISGEASTIPTNASGLNALARQLANNYYGWQVGAAFDEVYPGTFNWEIEGYHDVIWTYSVREGRATTRVLKTPWNQQITDMQQAAHLEGLTVSGTVTSGGNIKDAFAFINNQGQIEIALAVTNTSGTYISGSILSGLTGVPRGVGGLSVAQSWLGGNSGINLVPLKTVAPLTSGATTFYVDNVEYLPTDNRWRGQLGEETILFEGTSGGVAAASSGIIASGAISGSYLLTAAYRGIDGTRAGSHSSGESLYQRIPDAAYGINLVSQGRGAFSYPNQWTSGGIQGVTIVPQLQTIRALTGISKCINGVQHYSGELYTYDPTLPDPLWPEQEYVWLVERNYKTISSGLFFGGQFAGYSAAYSSGCLSGGSSSSSSSSAMVPIPIAPIYLVNDNKYCCEPAGASSSSSVSSVSSVSAASASSVSDGSTSSVSSSSSSGLCPTDLTCNVTTGCCPCVSPYATFTLTRLSGIVEANILVSWNGSAYAGTLPNSVGGGTVEIACVLSTTVGPSGSTNQYKWELTISGIPDAEQTAFGSCTPLSISFTQFFGIAVGNAQALVTAQLTGCPCSGSSCSSSSLSSSSSSGVNAVCITPAASCSSINTTHHCCASGLYPSKIGMVVSNIQGCGCNTNSNTVLHTTLTLGTLNNKPIYNGNLFFDGGGGGGGNTGVECEFCDSGTPDTWTFTMAGATGCFEPFNGTYVARKFIFESFCVWKFPLPITFPGTLGTEAYVSVGDNDIIVQFGTQWTDPPPPSVNVNATATYLYIRTDKNCCEPVECLFFMQNYGTCVAGTGTVPARITITPNNCGGGSSTSSFAPSGCDGIPVSLFCNAPVWGIQMGTAIGSVYPVTCCPFSGTKTNVPIRCGDLEGTATVTVCGICCPASSSASINPCNICYTAPGTHYFVVPAGVCSLRVLMWGGGGGGGCGGDTVVPAPGLPNDSGAGGGGGGYSELLTYAVTPGQVVPLYVGSGGNGGTFGATTNGSAGQDSYFATTATGLAKGGSGGVGDSTAGTFALGGQSSAGVGTVKYSGGRGGPGAARGGGGGGGSGTLVGDGQDGYNPAGAIGGAGGGCLMIPPFCGTGGDGGALGNAAFMGNQPGGGGGGGGHSDSTGTSGGAGAAGQVCVICNTTPCSSASNVSVPCCSVTSSQLTASFTVTSTKDCPCYVGFPASTILTYQGTDGSGNHYWTGTSTSMGCEVVVMTLTCVIAPKESWELTVTMGAYMLTLGATEGTSCSPFVIQVAGYSYSTGTCTAVNFNVTII